MQSESPWVVAIAVKSLHLAKSRMANEWNPSQRAALVIAMAKDVIAASLGSGVVMTCMVVTSDRCAARALDRPGVEVVLQESDTGLNSAYRHACAVRGVRGDAQLALVMADLPFLNGAELSAVLRRVPPHEAVVVADAQGSGTTLLAGRRASILRPAFGESSFARHVRAGALDATRWAGPGLRCDADRPSDILVNEGIGSATGSWLRNTTGAVGS